MVNTNITDAEIDQKWEKISQNPQLSDARAARVRILGAPLEKALRKAGLTHISPEGVMAQMIKEAGDADRTGGITDGHNYAGLTADREWLAAGKPIKESLDKQGPRGGNRVISQKFRQYESVDAFAEDYVKFIQKPRYTVALQQTTPYAFARELVEAGYCNDEPDQYATDVQKIARTFNPNLADPNLERTNFKDIGHQERGKQIAKKSSNYISEATNEEEKKNREDEVSSFLQDMMDKNPIFGIIMMCIMMAVDPEASKRIFASPTSPDYSPSENHGDREYGHKGYDSYGITHDKKLSSYKINAPEKIQASSLKEHNEKTIETLHPALRDKAREFLQKCEAEGINDLKLMEGYRSPERQDALYAQGRSKPGKIVTSVRGGSSYHNYGVAFDVCPSQFLSDSNWKSTDPVWKKMGRIGQEIGLTWGGDWNGDGKSNEKFIDQPHFQIGGVKISELKAAVREGRVDSNGYVKVAGYTGQTAERAQDKTKDQKQEDDKKASETPAPEKKSASVDKPKPSPEIEAALAQYHKSKSERSEVAVAATEVGEKQKQTSASIA